MIATNIRLKKYWPRKTAQTTTYNVFYASKFQYFVEGRKCPTWKVTSWGKCL